LKIGQFPKNGESFFLKPLTQFCNESNRVLNWIDLEPEWNQVERILHFPNQKSNRFDSPDGFCFILSAFDLRKSGSTYCRESEQYLVTTKNFTIDLFQSMTPVNTLRLWSSDQATLNEPHLLGSSMLIAAMCPPPTLHCFHEHCSSDQLRL
jgi:hypothetical protein